MFQVKGLNWKKRVNNVSLSLKRGEILGIYGLVGAGRSELLDLIFGIEHADSGSIRIGDKVLHHHSPAESIEAGIAYVTEDRKETGLVLSSSIAENVNISSLDLISRLKVVNDRKWRWRSGDMIRAFNIRTPGTSSSL